MSLVINGTTVPTSGNYVKVGNTNLDKVICNGKEVWKKQSDPITYTTFAVFPNKTATCVGVMLSTNKTNTKWGSGGHGCDNGHEHDWTTSDDMAYIGSGSFTIPSGAKKLQVNIALDNWGDTDGGGTLTWAGGNTPTSSRRIYTTYEQYPASVEFDIDGLSTTSFWIQWTIGSGNVWFGIDVKSAVFIFQ